MWSVTDKKSDSDNKKSMISFDTTKGNKMFHQTSQTSNKDPPKTKIRRYEKKTVKTKQLNGVKSFLEKQQQAVNAQIKF